MLCDLTGARQGFKSAPMGMPLSCAFLHTVSAALIANAELILVGLALCMAVMSTSLSAFALDHQSCHGTKQQFKSTCRLAVYILLDRQHGDPLLTCNNRANCQITFEEA